LATSKIEWTESTWNPVTGCTKISPGCDNCYAERMAHRLKAMGQRNYRNGFGLTTHEDALDLPLKWRSPRVIFVNSMSDLFHKRVPGEFIRRTFGVMRSADHHIFQLLTKRSRRMAQMSEHLDWPAHVWAGVSVENRDFAFRLDDLRATAAKVRFVSFEPLLGPVAGADLSGIDWVIVGGESGPGARPMEKHWVEDMRDQCLDEDIPFFFKQWGGTNKKKAGRALEGRTWEQMPAPS